MQWCSSPLSPLHFFNSSSFLWHEANVLWCLPKSIRGHRDNFLLKCIIGHHPRILRKVWDHNFRFLNNLVAKDSATHPQSLGIRPSTFELTDTWRHHSISMKYNSLKIWKNAELGGVKAAAYQCTTAMNLKLGCKWKKHPLLIPNVSSVYCVKEKVLLAISF